MGLEVEVAVGLAAGLNEESGKSEEMSLACL